MISKLSHAGVLVLDQDSAHRRDQGRRPSTLIPA
jgi:hypothetical protein